MTDARLPEDFDVRLLRGETVHAFARGRLLRGGTRRTTFPVVHLAVEAVDAVRNRRALHRARVAGVFVGFPLDRRMAFVVTATRLLILRRNRGRAPQLLGEVPRSRIAGATMPYVGGGWRTVIVETVDGLRVSFQVDREGAEAFVEALTT